MKQYRQCLLQRGTTQQTAWIETRAATLGTQVQLLPAREWWTVAHAYDQTLPENALREHQALNRHSLPSVEPIK